MTALVSTFDYARQPKVAVDKCNCCGSPHGMCVAVGDRYGFEARLFKCQSCGLKYLNPRMTKSTYYEFYREHYRALVNSYQGHETTLEQLTKSQAQYSRMLIAQLGDIETHGRLIDVGGSTGVVAKAFADQYGCDPTVLDPAPDELAVAEDLGCKTIRGMAEDLKGKWDVVLMLQTVEHLTDIARVFDKIRATGGLFIWDFVESQIKIDHPYMLCDKAADEYLRRAGFELERRIKWGKYTLHVCR